MVSVPKSYPKEPGAERCGDTYKMTAVVNGKIPGTVFGTQFTRNIPPVPIKGTSALVPVFTSRKNFDESLQRDDGSFRAHTLDETGDCEYTFYALLALGHLRNS